MEINPETEVRYGIIAYMMEGTIMSIFHFQGYEKQPTQHDIDNLAQELNSDARFGLIGRIGKDVKLMEASDCIIKEMTRQLKS
jgi:hypothetical protein